MRERNRHMRRFAANATNGRFDALLAKRDVDNIKRDVNPSAYQHAETCDKLEERPLPSYEPKHQHNRNTVFLDDTN
ncbi:unnamed protein product [Dovyalis caffra]|uniref:Uncharacterized protein n=1 Tax=Dovyalis caffra TaxID=77055 RepID=A0AAV1STX4_9ROSI|nr:unnamed protein product [Dovyalis caffra]